MGMVRGEINQPHRPNTMVLLISTETGEININREGGRGKVRAEDFLQILTSKHVLSTPCIS